MIVKNKARLPHPGFSSWQEDQLTQGLRLARWELLPEAWEAWPLPPLWALTLPGGYMNTWWEARLTPPEGTMEQELGVSKENGDLAQKAFRK